MPADHTESSRSSYIIDAEKAAELQRTKIQHDLVTMCMGGLLPEISDVSTIHDILDVSCGPGDWALQLARAYPQFTITGIGMSKRMIEYAQMQRTINTNFQLMDITQPLAFPDECFDFINACLLGIVLHKEAWMPLIQEYKRLLRPGGIIRLTELEFAVSNKPAAERFTQLVMQALQHSGHSVSLSGNSTGITLMLSPSLQEAGFQHIQRRAFVVDHTANSEGRQIFRESARMTLLLMRPFLLKNGLIEQKRLDDLCEQTLREMEDADYCANLFFLTVWGYK